MNITATFGGNGIQGGYVSTFKCAGIVGYCCTIFEVNLVLTLILLTWTVWRAPTNASKWRMGFNSAFKGLTTNGNFLVVPLLHSVSDLKINI